MRITSGTKLIIYMLLLSALPNGIRAFYHYHNDFFNSLNLSHSNQNFLILGFLIFLFVLFIKIKFLLPINIIISVFIIGQIAIMVSGQSGNAISNLGVFDPTEVVSEDKNKAEKISTTTVDPYHNDLPIDTRKKFFRGAVENESEAIKEAEERYPTSPDFSDSINLSHIISQNNYTYEKKKIYIKKCKITYNQMMEIQGEGVNKGW